MHLYIVLVLTESLSLLAQPYTRITSLRVHQNAVKDGLVLVANQHPWCSAAWFERTASPSSVKTIYSFKTDRLKIDDDY
jgi:hypothetical protein